MLIKTFLETFVNKNEVLALLMSNSTFRRLLKGKLLERVSLEKQLEKLEYEVCFTMYLSKGMSLEIYEGQITCLLGHNGAGKTTLINALTGLTPADSGQATIYGYSIRDPIQMQKIRSMMGVCSQDNTLFDKLSPREHLRVYAGLKGVPSEKVDAEVGLSISGISPLFLRVTILSTQTPDQQRPEQFYQFLFYKDKK